MPLTYDEMKDNPRQFRAVTSLTHPEFLRLLVPFAAALAEFNRTHTASGSYRNLKPRIPKPTSKLGPFSPPDQQLFFILYAKKVNPIQAALGATFGLTQSKAQALFHRLLPILEEALKSLEVLPTQIGAEVASHPLAQKGLEEGQGPVLGLDATDRRRERPSTEPAQSKHYSGKKKTHSDKNTIISNLATKQVVMVGPTHPGSVHDKKCVDSEGIKFPEGGLVFQDTGYQGHAPADAKAIQPQKSPKGGS